VYKNILIICICCFVLCSCGRVRVKTSWGYMGPNTYIATDGKIEVRYYNGACCCVAKQVLESLADKANSGELDWSLMADKEFRSKTLSDECAKQKEITQYGKH
jgi:hypothetical protein